MRQLLPPLLLCEEAYAELEEANWTGCDMLRLAQRKLDLVCCTVEMAASNMH